MQRCEQTGNARAGTRDCTQTGVNVQRRCLVNTEVSGYMDLNSLNRRGIHTDEVRLINI